MLANTEVLGLLLAEGEERRRTPRNAQMLLREADGRMRLQDVSTDSLMGQHAMNTGCFRRSKPIYDPITREIMGYEMERVTQPFGAAARAHSR
jgi:DNA repair protein RadC